MMKRFNATDHQPVPWPPMSQAKVGSVSLKAISRSMLKNRNSQFIHSYDMSEVERWNFLRANCSEGWISSGSDRWTNEDLEAFYEFTKHFNTGRYYHCLYVWTDHMK